MRVLIVDDEPDIRTLVNRILAPLAECEEAPDGGEGYRKFSRRLLQNTPYDLLVLDIMLPYLDGKRLLEKIRALEEENRIARVDGVKVIMLTAMDDTGNVIGSFKHGCDAYLTKPFDPEQLLAEVRDLGLA